MIRTVGMGQTYDALPLAAVRALESADTVMLQTLNSGCAEHIAQYHPHVLSLDSAYESASDFDELYALGVQDIVENEPPEGTLVFCYLGSPGTNGFLLTMKDQGVHFDEAGRTDLASEALQIAGMTPQAYTALDARDLQAAYLDTSCCVAVVGVDDAYTAAETKIALLDFYDDEADVWVVSQGSCRKMPLFAVDAARDWHDGAVFLLPPVPLVDKNRYTYQDLRTIMHILRAPDGCPWDAEQTHESLRPYLIEEAYEVSDAVSKNDPSALYDELGDVLLQVLFHSEIGRQAGEFTDVDVTTSECRKMIRRHPHVFADGSAATADEVLKAWDAIKQEEKGTVTAASRLADIPAGMGPLTRAAKLQSRAAGVGFDWPDTDGALEKAREELEELAQALKNGNAKDRAEEAGDTLFAVVNVLRLAGINPETALQDACAKFIRRFNYIEEKASAPLETMSLAQMDSLWNEAKELERKEPSAPR